MGNYGNAIEWYSSACYINADACDPFKGNGEGDIAHHPANDPGVAPMLHACGGLYLDWHHFGPWTGGNDCGSSVWTAGETIGLTIAINNNHGGWYQYRLCPGDDSVSVTNSDCEKNPLEFATNTTAMYAQFGGNTLPVPAATEFVSAQDKEFHGSTWRSVEYALTDGTVYVDTVKVPALPDGAYILQWRWDTYNTAQVWSSCADIVLQSRSSNRAVLV